MKKTIAAISIHSGYWVDRSSNECQAFCIQYFLGQWKHLVKVVIFSSESQNIFMSNLLDH